MTGPAKFRNILDVRGDNVMEMDFAIAPCIEFPEVEQEYRVGMKVNSLQMIYVERFVEELASFFVFLCSERASYCVGATYQVDGGMLKTV